MKEKAIFTSTILLILFLVFSLFSSLNKNQKTPLSVETIDMNTESDSTLNAYKNDYKEINESDLNTRRKAIDRFKKNRRRRARINRNTSANNAHLNRRLKELQEAAELHKKNSKAQTPNDSKKGQALTEEEKEKKEEADKKKKEQEKAKKEQEERTKSETQARSNNSLNEVKDSNISSLEARRSSPSSIITSNQNSIINENQDESESVEETATTSNPSSSQTNDETSDNTSLTEGSTEIEALIQERNTEGLLAFLESSNLSTFKRTSLNTLVKATVVNENIAFISPIVISTYLNINNLGLFTNSMIVDDYSFEEKSFMASLIMQSLDGSAKLLTRSDFVDLYFNGVKAQLSNTNSESNSSVLDLYSELDMKIDETYELLGSETEVASN